MKTTFFCSSCMKHHKNEKLHSVKKLRNGARNICVNCAALMAQRLAQKV